MRMQALPTTVDDDFDLDDPHGGGDGEDNDGGSDGGDSAVADRVLVKAPKRRGEVMTQTTFVHSGRHDTSLLTNYASLPGLTPAVGCAAASGTRKRQRQRVSKKGSASAPVSPCSGADAAPVLAELQRSIFSGAASAAAATSARQIIAECIVLDSDTKSEAAVHRSAPVSPAYSEGTWAPGHGGIVGSKRSITSPTSQRSLFRGPPRPHAARGLAAHELPGMPPPVQHARTQFSLGGADVSMQDHSGTAMYSSSPLPLRERLRQHAGSGLHPSKPTRRVPTVNLASYCGGSCRDFGQPDIAVAGGNIWSTQDTQPSVQALAGLETLSVLDCDGSCEVDHCISLLTP